MNFQHYLYLFLRNSWIIILIVAAVLAATWTWLSKQSPVYESRAVLLVETDQAKVVNIQDVENTQITNLDQLNTVVQTLTGNTILLAVARTTGKDEMWARKYGAPGGKLTPSMESALANHVAGRLNVSLRRNTRLIDIVASEGDPQKAQALADAVVKEFFALQNQDRSDISKGANEFLVAEADKLKTKLQESENRLAEYRTSHKAVSLNKDQNTVDSRLNTLSAEVTAANTQRAALETDLAALKQIPSDDVDGMLKLRSVSALPEVVQLRSAVNAEEGTFAAVKERYGPKHPKYGAAESQVKEAKAKLKVAVASAGEILRQQYRNFTETEQRLKEMLTEAENQALAMDAVSIPYNVLEREAATDRSLYEAVLTRLKETGVTQGLTKTPYRLIEEPLLNPNPVRPSWKKVMPPAGLVALLMGIGLVLLLDRMDSSFRTVDDAENVLEMGVLAAVPDGDPSKLPKGGTVMTDDSNSSQAEAFRTLRASLSLLGEEDQRRIILVTSAIPAEGKTFTSTNLAASFATQGLNTLLIDADLRRPALSAAMLERDVRQNEDFRGLTDVLSGLCPVEEAVRATRVQNLWLLPSGRRAPNPAELLSQGGMEKLLQHLSGGFDRIILDSAPINAVSDSLGVAPLAHAVCLVLRYGKTPRRAILRALGLLKKSGARMAGLVMNRMPSRRGAAYYYYYYGDPYVKDNVYGEQGQKKKSRKSGDESKWPEPAASIPTSRIPQVKK